MNMKGQTISFREIPNFDELTLEDATYIVYNELVPVCEGKGILLSQYGNHNGSGSLSSAGKYKEMKAMKNLFDVKRIQKAFSSVPDIVKKTSQYQTGSYGLKHVVERHPTQDEYITNGDWIVAMLLQGYKARFGKTTELMSVNCEFQAKPRKVMK